jgi:hypothetical protein
MKNVLIIIGGIFVGVALIGGAFSLIGAILGITFGIIGATIAGISKIIFTPAILVLIIIILAYKLNKKSSRL